FSAATIAWLETLSSARPGVCDGRRLTGYADPRRVSPHFSGRGGLAMKPAVVRLVVILAVAIVAACGSDKHGVSPVGPTVSGGIVVEGTALRSVEHGCVLAACEQSCRIEGSIRKDTTTARRVTLIFNAFDGKGQRISCTVLGNCSIRATNTSGGDLV